MHARQLTVLLAVLVALTSPLAASASDGQLRQELTSFTKAEGPIFTQLTQLGVAVMSNRSDLGRIAALTKRAETLVATTRSKVAHTKPSSGAGRKAKADLLGALPQYSKGFRMALEAARTLVAKPGDKQGAAMNLAAGDVLAKGVVLVGKAATLLHVQLVGS